MTAKFTGLMKAKFTGHDTFPLRYGWLFKAANLVNSDGLISLADSHFSAQTIQKLGVGKNMVNAIKYWAEVSKMVETRVVNRATVQAVTEIGDFLLDRIEGRDPYLEDIGSVWLLHFLLCFDDDHLTSYRYFFNYSNSIYFEKTKLADDLFEDLPRLTGSASVNKSTLKKDIECFLATYSQKNRGGAKKKTVDEDHFTSPLSELGLIQDLGRGFYQCDLGERPSLPIEIFTYALVEYSRIANLNSLSKLVSFEDLLVKPLSPGRIFKLSESELGRFLDEAVIASGGDIGWIDSLGLKQVLIEPTCLERIADILDRYYWARS